MRVTWLSPYVPQPASNSAGTAFLFHYLSALAQHHESRLVAPAFEENLAAAAQGPPGVELHLVPVGARRKTHIGRAIAAFPAVPGGLSPGLPVLQALRADPKTWSWVAESDLVEVQWSDFLPFVPDILQTAPGVPVTALVHEVASVSFARRASQAGKLVDRVAARLSLPRVRRSEPALLRRCQAAFVFSETERSALRALGVDTDIEVLDPYLFVPTGPVGPAGCQRVLFVGALQLPHNAESLLWFIDQVWPHVSARCPSASLVVAGGGARAELLARASPSVRFTGWVDDLDAEFREADIFVAPNRLGAGLKFKVPQAMLYGLPVVAASVAAEGIVELAGPEVFGAVSDHPQVLADAVVDLLVDPARASDVGARARAWASDHFSFDRTVSAVLEVYDRLHSAAARGTARGR